MVSEQDIEHSAVPIIRMPLSYWVEKAEYWGITTAMIYLALNRENKIIAYSAKVKSDLAIEDKSYYENSNRSIQ